MNGRANANRGAAAERAVVAYLYAHGWPEARRSGRGFPGSDILGVPWTIEVKDRVRSSWPSWCAQALAARRGSEPVIVVRRTRGTPDVGLWECRWTTSPGRTIDDPIAWVAGEPFGHVVGLLKRMGKA